MAAVDHDIGHDHDHSPIDELAINVNLRYFKK